MFDVNDFNDDDFKGHSFSVVRHHPYWIMQLVVGLVVLVGVLVVLGLLCRCCCRGGSRGRVIAPPQLNEDGTAPYPQQQYTTALYPAAQTVTVYPVGSAAYPAPAAGPFQSAAPYPNHSTPYPTGAPYPAGAPYPTGAPYPAGAPYPTAAGYPAPGCYPPAPSAPDANACPPSYDQVMGNKQPPYNPHAPQ